MRKKIKCDRICRKTAVFTAVFCVIVFSSVSAQPLRLVTLSSPPAEFLKEGRAAGRNVDIVRTVLGKMGYDFEIRFLPWQRALMMVKTGEADGIIDVAWNSERAKYLHYPEETLYVEQWYGFKLKSSPLSLDRKLGNAGAIRLGVTRGFEYGGIIQEAINGKWFKAIQVVHNNELNLTKLVGNRFDMFIGVKLTILSLAKEMGLQDRIEIIKMTGTDQDFLLSASKTYLGFSKKTMKKELAEEFSKVLSSIKTEGIVREIEEKYY